MTLREISRSLLQSSLAVRRGETVLIVTDNSRLSIGQALYEAAGDLGAEALLMAMAERTVSGEEPPKAVAEAMKAADVIVCPTAKSLTHTNARIEAVKAGARMATMPGITEAMFTKGAITADYDRVEALTAAMTQRLTEASWARVVKDGHELILDLRGRNGVPSPGVYRTPGTSGNLPSGEAYIAPLETGSRGSMVIDGSMVGVGKLARPITVTVEAGRLTKIEGDDGALGILLANERNGTLGELGIGTNEKAVLCGIILEDEKVYGTVHIAFGTNTAFGGVNKADCHMDGVILRPDLYLDDEPVIRRGEFLLEL
ncbi:aminopeptidase [Gehongia tenuis]|uniref:Aminopeptidase n=1 Tax=Gehongia tenuis TaxID=2763655 RepID=A0A926HN72_9FIRM|nr:aminopeptidase [Gehongia tenuis]MBC8530284.1 aminopeptidase [Gehongia tenuis]